MSTISVTSINDGDAVTAASINNQVNTIVNDYNGNITDANVSASAAIGAQKLAGGVSGMFGAWTSWTPSLTNLSGGTQTYARYIQLGKTVHFEFKYTLAGAGVAGLIAFSTPVTMAGHYSATDIINSTVFFYDVSATTHYQGSAFTASTTTISLKSLHTDGTRGNNEVTSSADPVTFATGDIIYCAGTFEAA